MIYRAEIFREDRGIVVLHSLKVSYLSNIPNRFYQSSIWKTGCVNYVPFRKSGHILYIYITIAIASLYSSLK